MKNNAAMEDHWSNNPRFKAEQEPVAKDWRKEPWGFGEKRLVTVQENTTPPQRTWVGLTNEESVELMRQVPNLTIGGLLAVEAKLKEKNT